MAKFLDEAGLEALWARITAADNIIETLANTKAQIAHGSYTGTGTSGSSNPNSLTFDFAPIIVMIGGDQGGSKMFDEGDVIYMDMLTTSYQTNCPPNYSSEYYCSTKKSEDGKTLYWYTSSPTYQLNYSGTKYYYIAIG